ncbi:MAG TPA: ABC transporter permease, partial [Longimicrobiales bacterium]|nr:ABC transporter permease [Longimicrobiales bacterium]
LTLGLGIGSVTTIFSLVDRILIRPLPYPEAERLVAVSHAAPGLGLERAGLSSGTYFHYREHAPSIERLALYTEALVNVSGGDAAAERVELAMVSPDFLDVMGVAPAIGRSFSAEEIATYDGLNMTGEIPVLLGHDLWRRRFGGDPSIVGTTVDVNARARRVIGVLPPGFGFPRPTTQIWMLSGVPARTNNFARGLDREAVARLAPGVSAEAAQAELARILPAIVGTLPDATPERFAEVGLRPVVLPLRDAVIGAAGPAIWILLGSMGLLLVAACANVANLCLVRSHQRLGETRVRSALGAGSRDLAGVVLAESALLSAGGAALGLLLAVVAVATLVTLAPVELPRLSEVRIDLRTLTFALGLGSIATLVIGALPILRYARPTTAASAVRAGGRGLAGDREARWPRGSLVAAQVALAVTLLVGSFLMGRSFVHLVDVDPGFHPEDVLVVEMGLPFSRAARHREIFDALLERVRALPGVVAAAGASHLPLAESIWTNPLRVPLRVDATPVAASEVQPMVPIHFFMPSYFQVMRMPVLEGAGFGPEGPPDVPSPVVISDALARRLFPGRSALGERIRRLDESGEEITYFQDGAVVPHPDYVVAGVVADVRQASLRDAPAEIVYIPVLDPPVDPGFVPTEMDLVIRSAVPPLTLAPAIREIIREIDPVLGVAQIRTLEGIISASVGRERFLATLLLVAGMASLLLGAVGVYGVVAYSVRQRTREIGVRMALGARRTEVVRSVLRDALPMVLAGTIVGLAAATFATRVLGAYLFGVRPGDPVVLGSVALFVVAVALLAVLVPAARAARIDPALALSGDG